MKILAIAPHMDDEVLGIGGTLRKHVLCGDNVNVCIVAHRVYNHHYDVEAYNNEKKSVFNAKKIIGYDDLKFLDLNDERLDLCLQDIIIPLEDYYHHILPELVYINFWDDNNQDHRAVFNAARVIIRRTGNHPPNRVFVYETPSSTDQSPSVLSASFAPNYYVNIDKTIEDKLKAINCYEREKRIFPHPRSVEAIKNLAIRRGVESGFNYAESFMTIYDQWK